MHMPKQIGHCQHHVGMRDPETTPFEGPGQRFMPQKLQNSRQIRRSGDQQHHVGVRNFERTSFAGAFGHVFEPQYAGDTRDIHTAVRNIHTHTHTCPRTHGLHIHTCIYNTHMCVRCLCLHAYTTHISICLLCVYKFIYIYLCVYIYMYMYICIYIYKYIYIYIYIYIHKYR